MNITRLFVFGAVIASTTLVGCAQPGLGGSNYTRGQVRGEQTVRVEHVHVHPGGRPGTPKC